MVKCVVPLVFWLRAGGYGQVPQGVRLCPESRNMAAVLSRPSEEEGDGSSMAP